MHLVDGKISGGDCFFSYGGSYEVDNDRFTATLTTRRCADGPTTLFGVDEVEVKLTGAVNGTIACCSGTSEQAPGVHFEATLFLGEDQPPRPAPQRPLSTFKTIRLPNRIGERRTRNPLFTGPSR